MSFFSFHEHPVKLNIKNLDEKVVNFERKKAVRKNGCLFPDCLRALIIGSSNSGKTNLVVTILLHPNGLRYENCYIYCKTLYQSKYLFLDKIFKDLKEIDYQTFSNNEEIIPVDEIKLNSVLVLDDVILENQKVIREFFCRSRHKNCDILYITQSYARLYKQLIRENANFLVIFRQDLLSIKHIFDDHVGGDLSFNEFLELCKLCWGKSKYGFLVISKEDPLNEGRYRFGFDTFIHIEPKSDKKN